MQANWRDHIVSTADVLRGKPRIKGTRIPVGLILGYLAADNTVEEILEEFPDLAKEHITACLDYARELSEDNFKKKIEELKEAVRDNLFLDDLRDISENFRTVDLEGWGQEDGV